MRTKQILLWVLILSLASVVFVSRPALSVAADTSTRSGIFLLASANVACTGTVRYGVVCTQPYAGEMVVTALNGEEITRLWTNFLGQAMVSLPPGQYLIGVRTESYYPRAAPVRVEVVADRYAYVALRMDLEPGEQSVAR